MKKINASESNRTQIIFPSAKVYNDVSQASLKFETSFVDTSLSKNIIHQPERKLGSVLGVPRLNGRGGGDYGDTSS